MQDKIKQYDTKEEELVLIDKFLEDKIQEINIRNKNTFAQLFKEIDNFKLDYDYKQ